MFDTHKLEWLDYHVVKFLWRYVKQFRYNTGTWQTDRQTDRRTDKIAISISLVSIAVLTLDKNCIAEWPSIGQRCSMIYASCQVMTFILTSLSVGGWHYKMSYCCCSFASLELAIGGPSSPWHFDILFETGLHAKRLQQRNISSIVHYGARRVWVWFRLFRRLMRCFRNCAVCMRPSCYNANTKI